MLSIWTSPKFCHFIQLNWEPRAKWLRFDAIKPAQDDFAGSDENQATKNIQSDLGSKLSIIMKPRSNGKNIYSAFPKSKGPINIQCFRC